MIYIVPSRGRPENINQLIESFTTTRIFTELVVAIDMDDPKHDEYHNVCTHAPEWVHFAPAPTHTMVQSLNTWAVHWAGRRPNEMIGFMGDDHRPRTYGWDSFIEAASPSDHRKIVYCNDLLQGQNLPTQVAMPASWILALGRMAPDQLHHLYVDNYWRILGNNLARLAYLPDVIIEHMHPVAGKAEWDDGYRRVNAGGIYQRDERAFSIFMNETMNSDLAILRAVI